MALSIRNKTAEKLARELASLTGMSMTDSIISALEEKLQKTRKKKSLPGLFDELLTISKRCGELPDLDNRSTDEILGYDEHGGFDGH